MKIHLKNALAIIVTIAVIFTAVPGITIESYAAAKTPAKVTKLKSSAITASTVKLSWKKSKGASGYQIVLNGKAVTNTKSTSYTLGGLKAGTKYSVKVRAYKSNKKYYNTKKKKWVSKKPKASQWKTKKTRIKNKYGKYSSTISFNTKAAPANINYPSLEQARTETVATINAHRVSRNPNARELVIDDTANRIAQKKAEYLAKIGRAGEEEVWIDALGGGVFQMMQAEGIEVWDCMDVYAPNITSFDKSIVNKTDNAVGGGMSGSFNWAENQNSFEHIGVGYCRGYLEIVFVQYAREL